MEEAEVLREKIKILIRMKAANRVEMNMLHKKATYIIMFCRELSIIHIIYNLS